MRYSKVSVIIPVRIHSSADVALESLKKVDYPKDLIEIFVVEGNNPSRPRKEAIEK